MLAFLKKIFSKERLDYKELLNKQAIIIDVRTVAEFKQGHVDHSRNIPLDELSNHVHELKRQNKPIITCCRSGIRSASAAATLKRLGLEVYNGGSWKEVRDALNQISF